MFKYILILAIVGALVFGVFTLSDIGDFADRLGGVEIKTEVSVGQEESDK